MSFAIFTHCAGVMFDESSSGSYSWTVTSGIDGIFPKGFVVGRIETVEKSGPSYKRIMVKPAVDFSRLEDVLVVLTPTPARDTRAGGSE